jgi:hypothetical protein
MNMMETVPTLTLEQRCQIAILHRDVLLIEKKEMAKVQEVQKLASQNIVAATNRLAETVKQFVIDLELDPEKWALQLETMQLIPLK